MIEVPLDEAYLTWLYSQFADTRLKSPTKTYWTLATQLFKKEFVWIVPNDDNRVEDGKDLRHEFLESCEHADVDDGWLHLGCSMLEMLVALSRRLEFATDIPPAEWFWHMLKNVGLDSFTDSSFQNGEDAGIVDEICDRIIWRTYHPNGRGGLFPLLYPKDDQRGVEIWYQFNAYIDEHDNI